MNIGEMIRSAQGKDVRLGIGIISNYDRYPREFFYSYAAMHKPETCYLIQPNQDLKLVEDMRNDVALKAKAAGCTHVAMLDIDQDYKPDTIMRLLSHRLPIVSALICRRHEPFDPLIFSGERYEWKPIESWAPGEVLEVSATGAGCIMIDTSVLDKIQYPWFQRKDVGTLREEGEDFYFCSEARKAGFKVHVDTSVQCIHYATVGVTVDTWKQYKKLRNDHV